MRKKIQIGLIVCSLLLIGVQAVRVFFVELDERQKIAAIITIVSGLMTIFSLVIAIRSEKKTKAL